MANVVAAVTAHVQRLHNAGDTTAQTPAQYAQACGYPGSKASALRAHIARQHGQGAHRTGHGRYPAVTPAQMLALLGAGHLVRKPEATAQQRKQAAATVKRTLWAKQRAAGKAGARQAKRAAAAQPSEVTAQPTQPAPAAVS